MLQALLITHNLGDVFCLPFFFREDSCSSYTYSIHQIQILTYLHIFTCHSISLQLSKQQMHISHLPVIHLSNATQLFTNSSLQNIQRCIESNLIGCCIPAFLRFGRIYNFWRHPTQRKGTIGFSAKVHDSFKFNFDKYTIRRHWNTFSDFEVRCAFVFLSATAMWVAIGQPASEVPKPLFCSTKNVFWQLFNLSFISAH